MVPRSTVHTFSERLNLMSQVISKLCLSQEVRDLPRSIALWGIGGSGKSQLALRFIEMHKDKYTTILWIDAQTPEAAIRSYSEAFGKLKLDYPQHIIDESRDDSDLYDQQGISTAHNWIIRTVNEWLDSTPCNWLVVIDNADNLRWIQDIMPKGRMGSLIITSRDRMVYRVVNHAIHVDKMSTEEALDLLLRSANILSNSRQQYEADSVQQKSQEHQAFLIVDQLGYLALAIDLAGAYISQHDFVQEDLSLYLKFLEQNSVALLGKKALQDAGDYDHTVATVWETSFTAINQTSPASAHLLTFLAYLSTTSVDDRLFDEASMFMYQGSGAHPTWSFLRQALLSAIFHLLPGISVQFIFVTILPLKPHLRDRVLMILIPSALTFVTTAPILIEEYEGLQGNSVKIDHAVWNSETIAWALSMGFAVSIGIHFTVFVNEMGYFFITIMLSLIYNIVSFGSEFYKSNVDEKVASRSRRLLDQLDFSHSNKAQFLAVAHNIQITSESAEGVLFVIVSIALPLAVYAIFRRTRTLRHIADTIGACWGPAVLCWLLGALLNSKEPSPFQTSTLVNNLLTTTSDGQWNRQAYSEVMAPLTRFSLIQRETDAAYSMHVLVRWWARNRLPPEIQQAWTREVDRFISMAYKSTACSVDPLCQQILIPQLLGIANSRLAISGVTTEETRNNLRGVLSKIDRSLRLVGKSHGILPDD